MTTALVDLSEAWRKVCSETWQGWWVMLAGLVGFFLVGSLTLVFSGQRSGQLTLGGIFKYVFPPGLFKNAHSRVDLACFLLMQVVFIPLIALVVILAVGLDVRGTLIAYLGVRPALLHASWAVLMSQFMVIYISGELSVYCSHRLMHVNELLWSFHRPHHSAELMTFLTSLRGNPVEAVVHQAFSSVISGLCTGVFLYATGTMLHPSMPVALLGLSMAGSIAGNFNHSHLRISFGPLNYVLMAGSMHQVHHSAEPRHRNKNFGGTLSLFDWMFGTIYIPAKQEFFRLGLSEGELGAHNPHKTALDLFLEPFAYAASYLKKRKDLSLD